MYILKVTTSFKLKKPPERISEVQLISHNSSTAALCLCPKPAAVRTKGGVVGNITLLVRLFIRCG